MKKTVRVIVTYDCPRNCPNCCNEHLCSVPEIQFEDLLKYEEVIITGGEPMLLAPRIVEMIHRLRGHGFGGKIWLYSSGIKTARWADRAVVNEVDGITYTIHHKPSRNDLSDAMKLSKYIRDNLDNRTHSRSDRLFIDSRCYTDEVMSIIGIGTKDCLGHWSIVKSLKWKNEKCPIPENEDLVFYDLKKEGND